MLNIKPKETYILEAAKIGGLLLYFFIFAFSWLINPYLDITVGSILLSSFSRLLSGYITISLLFSLLNYLSKRNLATKKTFLFLFIPISYILSVIWIILSASFLDLVLTGTFSFSTTYFIKSFSFLYIVIAFAGLYYLINHWLNLKKQKEMTLQATILANEAQLQMLRYQINPHFLFNALNTIRSMVEEDKAVARNMITELANFFRYSLSQNGTTDTFENEINAIKNYLEIQKIRFEEKLNIIYDIDEKLYNIKIPFFIILPLVENAIKFGLQTSSTPLNIKIVAKANSQLEIRVHNSGKIIENNNSSEGTKTGIENTKKRLALYFPDKHTFRLYEDNSWVISEIIISDYKNQIAK